MTELKEYQTRAVDKLLDKVITLLAGHTRQLNPAVKDPGAGLRLMSICCTLPMQNAL
jgi:hypothetical protein